MFKLREIGSFYFESFACLGRKHSLFAELDRTFKREELPQLRISGSLVGQLLLLYEVLQAVSSKKLGSFSSSDKAASHWELLVAFRGQLWQAKLTILLLHTQISLGKHAPFQDSRRQKVSALDFWTGSSDLELPSYL